MRRDAIVIKSQENVATAIRDIPAGKKAEVGVGEESVSVTVSKDISFGHKLSLRHIRNGEEIIKYGTVIGRATQDIQPGEHVHVHNVESTRGRGDLA